jgi:hypothetical protein
MTLQRTPGRLPCLLDNRIVITRDGSTEKQTLGDQTSYTYQLAALQTGQSS